MNEKIADYTFLGLLNKGIKIETPITSLAYLIALVDSSENEILNMKTAKFVLRYLFDVEEQVKDPLELLSVMERNFPKSYFPQTPVMVTHKWSPISALLEKGWALETLVREDKQLACASGIWQPGDLSGTKPLHQCDTTELLFWHILEKVVMKAKVRSLLISIIAMPGWSYKSNFGRPHNLTLAEAEQADRVIWQRTPNVT
jgi:hypothetical protein